MDAQPRKTRAHLNDLTGKQFGWLTVLRLAPRAPEDKEAKWVCKCNCGKETVVKSYNLRHGHTRSCGCYRRSAHLYRK